MVSINNTSFPLSCRNVRNNYLLYNQHYNHVSHHLLENDVLIDVVLYYLYGHKPVR